MPRNGSGIYSLPEPAFVPNTVISSTAVNSDFNDIASALTASLPRDGQAGMTAILPLSTQGLTYSSDTNTGLRRTGADTQEIYGNDIAQATFSTTGVDFPLGFTVAGSPLVYIGMVSISSLTSIPPLWLASGTYLRADFPLLWAVAQAEIALGNVFYTNGNGSTTFTIETTDGYVPGGVDAAAARISGFTNIGNTAGSATRTLLTANLPAYTPSGLVSVGAPTLNIGANTYFGSLGTDGTSKAALLANSSGSSGGANPFSITNISANAPSASFSGDAQGGSSTAFGIVQPSRAFKFIVYAGE